MRLCAICIKCLDCPKRPELLVFRSEPPIKFDHFLALLHAKNTFYGQRRAIQSSANPGKTTSKTFANLCHRNILTASRRTRKTTFIFPGRTERNSQIRRQADTSCLSDRVATSVSRQRPQSPAHARSRRSMVFTWSVLTQQGFGGVRLKMSSRIPRKSYYCHRRIMISYLQLPLRCAEQRAIGVM